MSSIEVKSEPESSRILTFMFILNDKQDEI